MEINLNEWILTGEGAEGQSFSNKTDSTILLKLYNKGKDAGIEKEQQLAKIVSSLGINTPHPGELVTCGDRNGIIFKKIEGKQSYSRLIADNPEKIDEIAAKFAKICRQLHGMPLSTTEGLDDYRSHLMFKNRKLEAPTCYCHGDLHMGNIITDGKKDYFIDLSLFCIGTPDYDLGVTYFICNYTPDFMMKKEFHISTKQGRHFWKVFSDAYFEGTPDKVRHLEAIRLFAIDRLYSICAPSGVPALIPAILAGQVFEFLHYSKLLKVKH